MYCQEHKLRALYNTGRNVAGLFNSMPMFKKAGISYIKKASINTVFGLGKSTFR